MSNAPVFSVRGVRYAYGKAAPPAVDDVSFEIGRGSFYTILGPNGSGKSTILKTMLGSLEPDDGSVHYEGRDLKSWGRRELARRIGVVPQVEHVPFPLTVQELVSMGRYPHIGLLGRTGVKDEEAIERALTQCGMEGMSSRSIEEISGGEMQRARIARALAQEPQTLVLDEPTASLDLHHEMETFELLLSLAEGSDITVIVVTHNLNLAARYASHMLLLNEGKIVGEGSPTQVLSQKTVEKTFQWPVAVVLRDEAGPNKNSPQVVPLSVSDIEQRKKS